MQSVPTQSQIKCRFDKPMNLKKWRERMGVTRAQAAELIGIGRNTYAAYEKQQEETFFEPPKYILMTAKWLSIEATMKAQSDKKKPFSISALIKEKMDDTPIKVLKIDEEFSIIYYSDSKEPKEIVRATKGHNTDFGSETPPDYLAAMIKKLTS